jgi:hypothetical protein
MRKIALVLVILFSLSLAFAQVALQDKKSKANSPPAPVDIDYDAVNNNLAKQTRDEKIRKEKEKILNQEIKVKINNNYKSVINIK